MKNETIFLSLIFFYFLTLTISSKPIKVIFFGDSITELAVKNKGYINVLKNLLNNEKESNFEIVGSGISGNKIYDLYLRLETDVLNLNPDIVIIFVGVNDVWHKSLLGTGTDENKFILFYEAIIQKLKSKGIKIALTTPALIGEKKNCTNKHDGELNSYSQIIRDLAAKHNLFLCDLRKDFQDYILLNNIENLSKGILTTDGVHLNEKGNEFAAKKFLELIKSIN